MVVTTAMIMRFFERESVLCTIPEGDLRTYRFPCLMPEGKMPLENDVLYVGTVSSVVSGKITLGDAHIICIGDGELLKKAISENTDPGHSGTSIDEDTVYPSGLLLADCPEKTPEELLRRLQIFFAENEQWLMDLKEAVLQGGTYQDILDIAADKFDADVIVCDSSFSAVAKTGKFISGDPVLYEIMKQGFYSADTLEQMRRWSLFEKYSAAGDIVKNEPNIITGRGSTCGYWCYYKGKPALGIVMTCASDKVPAYLESLFRYLVEVVEACFRRNAISAGTAKEPHEVFICSLLDGKMISAEQMEERASALGIAFRGYFKIYTVGASDGLPFLTDFIRPLLESIFVNGMTAVYDNRIVILVSFKNDAEAYEKLRMHEELVPVLQRYDMSCGISRVFNVLSDLPTAYEQSVMAARYGTMFEARTDKESSCGILQRLMSGPDMPEIYFYENVSIYRMIELSLEYGREIFRLSPFIKALKELKEYDARTGNEYYNILFVYLSLERNTTETAKTMNLSRTGLLYHIPRIRDIIKVSLDNPNIRFSLLLAFRVMEMQTDPESKD